MGAIDWAQMNGGDAAAPAQGGAIDWSQVNSAPAAAPATPAPQSPGLGSMLYNNMVQPYVDLGKGAYRGLQNITDTLMQGGSTAVDKLAGTNTRASVDAAIKGNRAAYEAGLKNPNWAKAGEIGGEIVGTLPLAPESGATWLAGKAGPAVANALGKVPGLLTAANGAIQGGVTAGLTSSTSDAPLGQQIATGAGFGAVAAPLAAGVGRVLSPKGPSAAAQQMLDNGVTPTAGQLGGGWMNSAEQKLMSVPVVGDMIKGARTRAAEDLNVAVANRALAPIGQVVDKGSKAGSDLVEQVSNKIGSVYDSVQPKAQFVADPDFYKSLTGIRAGLAETAPGALPQFDNLVKNQIQNKLSGGSVDTLTNSRVNASMSGAQWGDTRSMINRVARERSAGNASADDRNLADALNALQGAINTSVFKHSPADVQPSIQSANAAWAQYKQMERAAGTVGAMNRGNVFSPAQYVSAVRKDLSAGQRAQGRGLNTEFAQNAQQVLGASVPDSGTAGRLGTAGAVGAMVSNPGMLLNPGLYAGALPALAYTPLGQKLMAAGMQARPGMQPAADALWRLGPAAAGLLGSAQDGQQMPDQYLLGQ